MLSKKHYIAVAKIIESNRSDNESAVEYTRQTIARDLAQYFERDNGRFDRERFLAACGIQS